MKTPNENSSQPSLDEALYNDDYSLDERQKVIEQASDEGIVHAFLKHATEYALDGITPDGFSEAHCVINESALAPDNKALVNQIRAFMAGDLANDCTNQEGIERSSAAHGKLVDKLFKVGCLQEPTVDSIEGQMTTQRKKLELYLQIDSDRAEGVKTHIERLQGDLEKL